MEEWHHTYTSSKMTRWNKKGFAMVEVAKEKINGKTVYFLIISTKDKIADQEFSKKSLALKSAKEYMETH